MFNLFAQFKGLEVFGIYETMKGVRGGNDQEFTQTALQGLYRFGDFYAGGRWNKVDNNNGTTVQRTNIGGGWKYASNSGRCKNKPARFQSAPPNQIHGYGQG